MTTKPLTLITSALLLTVALTVSAQIVTDETVGPRRVLDGPNYQIGDDLGSQSGTNLYHSFDKFNIKTGETATFTGPQDINNVFGRVTGGGQSLIDGQIRSEIPFANIYLINPNGILFGENASLDVSGSFYASTANQIILKDGTEFSATHPANSSPILSAEPFEAFGFLDDNQAQISVQGSTLEVEEGQTLGLASHQIDIKGSYPKTSGGHIKKAQITSGGHIEIDSHPTSSADLTTITVQDGTKITVRSEGQGRIFFRGGKLVIDHSNIQMQSEAPGSSIKIDASQMSLTNDARITIRSDTSDVGELVIGENGRLDSLEINNSVIRTRTYTSGNAGNVSVTAKRLQMNDGEIQAHTYDSGDAGKVLLSAEKIVMTDGSEINTKTSGSGNAGDIRITAKKPLNLSLTDSQIVADSYDNGNGGRIAIISNDGSIRLSNSFIQANAEGSGQGGYLSIDAQEINLTENSGILAATLGQESASGDAGLLQIDTDRLNVTYSTIAAGTIGPGTGGEVQIQATESITLSGNSTSQIAGQPLYALTVDSRGSGNATTQPVSIETPILTLNNATMSAATSGSGNAGDLTIKADEIHLNNDSLIMAATLPNSLGNGGNLTIDTGRLSVTDSSIAAGTLGSGKGGQLKINAQDSITLSGNSPFPIAAGQPPLSAIAIGTQGTSEQSNAGDAYIETPNLTLTNQAALNADTSGPGNAGHLTIKAAEINLNNSQIQATTSGSGQGGELEIDSNQIILTNNSGLIVASLSQEENAGNAGSLAINTGTLNVNQSTIAAGTLGSGDGSESVQIKARERITLSGESSITTSNPKILEGRKIPSFAISVDSRDSGNATSSEQPVSIETPILTLDNGAAISVATFGSGQGGNLEITADEALSIDQSNIVSATLGSGTGGSINIKTKNMALSGKSDKFLSQYDLSSISSATLGAGQGGNVQIETEQLRLDNAAISAKAEQSGNAGSLFLNASQLITNTQSEISTEAQSSVGGDITINTPELIVTNNGSINADVINGDRGGNINITVNTLDITHGGQLTSSSEGKGKGGNITITASHYVNLFDSKTFDSKTGLMSSTTNGRAGLITVTTPQLTLSNGKINTSATSQQGHSGSIAIGVSELNMTDDSSMSAKSSGSGNAGSVIVNASAGSVTLNNSEITTESQQQGAGGLINIHAGDLLLQNQGEINAQVNQGRGGANIDVIVDRLTLENASSIESSTVGSSRAGKITITATEYLHMTGKDSGIFSQAENAATGAAGEILIGTTTVPVQSLTIENGSQISTASKGTGRAAGESANIEILAEQLSLKQGTIQSSTEGQSPAGTITITSEYLNIDDGDILSESSNTGNAGQITIGQPNQPVQTLTLTNEGKISTTTLGEGSGGEIHLTANRLDMNKGSSIESSTKGDGHAGTITITASEYLNLFGGDILSESSNTGNAGEILIGTTVPVQSLTIENGSQISTASKGTGREADKSSANIEIIAEKLSLKQGTIQSSTDGKSPAGTITIKASEYINIFGGEILSNSGDKENTEVTGNAGQITLQGQENQPHPTITLTNSGTISTTTLGKGAGGQIHLTANRLDISEGSQIESSTNGAGDAGTITITASEYINIFGGEILSNSGDEKNTEATGKAGEINIVAGGGNQNDRKPIPGRQLTAEYFPIENDIEKLLENRGLTMNGGQISTSTQGKTDSGGEITLTTSQLKLTNQAEISATSSGKAGDITIGTALLGISDSTISTESSASDGGNILIGLNNLYGKRITNSRISARAGQQGGGGNLEILGDAPYIILDHTNIIAEAEQGSGGNITIKSTADKKAFIASGDSRVSASSQRDDGEVTIDSAQVDIGSLIPLPNDPVDASKLIKDCAAASSGKDDESEAYGITEEKEGQWSLIQVGRDGQKGNSCLR